jgi:hypothetical protein
VETRPAPDCWREDDVLVMRTGSALPERCVKCNAPAIKPIKTTTFYWHHPGWYLLILFYVFLYVIVALIVRRKAKAAIGACAKHRMRRRIFMGVGWGGLILGIAAFSAGDIGVALGLTIILIAAIAGIVGSRFVYPTRITDTEMRLKGCGEAFLASLALEPASRDVDVRAHGVCPNCDKVILLASAQCPHCTANFGEGAAWKIVPLRVS